MGAIFMLSRCCAPKAPVSPGKELLDMSGAPVFVATTYWVSIHCLEAKGDSDPGMIGL